MRFVRTPEGKGVGVIREKGGESWIVGGKGMDKLERVARWPAADLVVVLDGGMTLYPVTLTR